jgi:hypothetical protein
MTMSDLPGAAMNRDELIFNLARIVAGDAALMLHDWKHLVLISQIADGTPDMTGFCYTGDGRAVPVAPSDFAIFDVIEDLRDAMAQADEKRPWLAALFRIARDTGKLHADFEYHHPERWLVTPSNVEERAREFAPVG